MAIDFKDFARLKWYYQIVDRGWCLRRLARAALVSVPHADADRDRSQERNA